MQEDDDDENMDNADLGSFDLSDNDNDHSYDSQQSDKSQEDLDGFADNAHDSTVANPFYYFVGCFVVFVIVIICVALRRTSVVNLYIYAKFENLGRLS